jgi:adenylate kinase family enzyme
MTRIAVIGNAGGGKSTLCRQLSAALQLPYFPVDKIQWKPGWKSVSASEFTIAHDKLLEHGAWIIDGFGPWAEVEKRFDAADTIIFVDLPLWVHYWWATKRQLASIFWGRPDGPDGCPMFPVTIRLYRMMWQIHRQARPRLVTAIEARRSTKRIFHLRSPRELAAFRDQYCLSPA